MTHSNFIGTQFIKTELDNTRMQNCIYDEQDLENPSDPVLSM